ncbi:hypothetical protein [Planctellipticum variicoloris]|uniref:hypothetical protein n=1 Tax=Planctellipticum variicoloris TaxID=3064265 RepID=UPI003014175F|nr:hypothetical protein SH412_002786 [Planctomycetaceae bacterium SH412]
MLNRWCNLRFYPVVELDLDRYRTDRPGDQRSDNHIIASEGACFLAAGLPLRIWYHDGQSELIKPAQLATFRGEQEEGRPEETPF